MAKPQQLHRDRPNPEEIGDGAEEAEEEGEGKVQERGGEGGGGKERAAHDTPTPPAEFASGTEMANQLVWRVRSQQRSRSLREPKREKRRMERPQGGPQSRSHEWRRMPPPPLRKTQTSWYSTQNVCTGCCRESMETSRIKTTGYTWTGDSRRRCMVASLAPARCTISELVLHVLWRGGSPLHSDPRGGMARGSITEL